jgi:fructose-1,6-bisphosphatase II
MPADSVLPESWRDARRADDGSSSTGFRPPLTSELPSGQALYRLRKGLLMESGVMPRTRVQVTPDHNLALDLVRTTEAAALAAARWVGRGEKIAADQAAVDAMCLLFNTVPFDGIVVIGEAEKDEAPMLFNGEVLGTGTAPPLDVAVDPIDGTRLVARGEANAMSVVAVAQRGSMFNPGPCVYMEKIAVGREGREVIDITAPIEDNVRNVTSPRRGEWNRKTSR